MRNILCKGGDRIELNALFVQPTRLCINNCKNCYVKKHQKGATHLNQCTFDDLLRKTLYREKISVNQITVSFDSFGENVTSRRILKPYLRSMVLYKKLLEEFDNDTEIHGTFHSISDIKQYSPTINNKLYFHTLDKTFSMISISSIDSLEDLRELRKLLPNVDINYNHMIPGNVNHTDIVEYVHSIKKIGEIVSSIYLIVEKYPIGTISESSRNFSQIEGRLLHDIAVINTLKKRLSGEKVKLICDGCVEDIIKYKRTGYGCSSNISRVQLWPNGTVTGCAYAYKSSNPEAREIKGILNNIKNVQNEYDFDSKCYLREINLPSDIETRTIEPKSRWESIIGE